MRHTHGNILDADAEALVNTVNTVGVMGKGIALMFKKAYPKNFKAYQKACKAKRLKVGSMFVTESGMYNPKWIVNFPTKEHWRGHTKIEWVIDGLKDLRDFIRANDVKSIAIPPLGCGNGGLNWADVKPHIVSALGDLSGVDIVIYEPAPKHQSAQTALNDSLKRGQTDL